MQKIWIEEAVFDDVTTSLVFYGEDEKRLARVTVFHAGRIRGHARDDSLRALFTRFGATIDDAGDGITITMNGRMTTPAGSQPLKEHIVATLDALGIEAATRPFSDESERAFVDLKLPIGGDTEEDFDFFMQFEEDAGGGGMLSIPTPDPVILWADNLEDAKVEAEDFYARNPQLQVAYTIRRTTGEIVFSSEADKTLLN